MQNQWQASEKIIFSTNKKMYIMPKLGAQSHTIVKQICFPNGNVLFLLLFSLSKNWMNNVVWGCAEILPYFNLTIKIEKNL